MDPRSRLRLRCRRGMRELDLLLGRFVETRYDGLDAAGRDAFERLLERTDPELIDWIYGRSRPGDPALAALVDQITGYRAD